MALSSSMDASAPRVRALVVDDEDAAPKLLVTMPGEAGIAIKEHIQVKALARHMRPPILPHDETTSRRVRSRASIGDRSYFNKARTS